MTTNEARLILSQRHRGAHVNVDSITPHGGTWVVLFRVEAEWYMHSNRYMCFRVAVIDDHYRVTNNIIAD